METKTHWKKNLDSKFISGEDLKGGLNGLKSEMNVVIEKFSDAQTFDQNKQTNTVITGLFLKEINGKSIYKPTVLNKTNAKFLSKEFGSELMEDWINKPVTIWAMPDSRHGFVVRFKKFAKPVLINGSKEYEGCKKAIDSGSYTLEQIKTKYTLSKEVETLLTTKS